MKRGVLTQVSGATHGVNKSGHKATHQSPQDHPPGASKLFLATPHTQITVNVIFSVISYFAPWSVMVVVAFASVMFTSMRSLSAMSTLIHTHTPSVINPSF